MNKEQLTSLVSALRAMTVGELDTAVKKLLNENREEYFELNEFLLGEWEDSPTREDDRQTTVESMV